MLNEELGVVSTVPEQPKLPAAPLPARLLPPLFLYWRWCGSQDPRARSPQVTFWTVSSPPQGAEFRRDLYADGPVLRELKWNGGRNTQSGVDATDGNEDDDVVDDEDVAG